jgi:N-acetyl-gamma-glutamyl-phosphate reductase
MTKNKIQAGIIGAAGYTGGETLRLLINHPRVEITFTQSRSQAGLPVTSVHKDLLGESDLIFSDGLSKADVIFLCLGHGESLKFIRENQIPAETKIIDLSQDFRLKTVNTPHNFLYGLPELNREEIKKSNHIANPGCFATAIQLGLLPLASRNKLGAIHTTGITGSTGAGQKLQETTHFNWRANNISAYKTLNHQHLLEIRQSIIQLQAGFKSEINFVPWRGDFTRGIFVTSVLKSEYTLNEIYQLYQEYFSGHPFTFVSENPIDLKMVQNTNKCLIQIEKQGDSIAIHSCIDNLLKGASGQAVQNMNLMFGLSETTGLHLKSQAF